MIQEKSQEEYDTQNKTWLILSLAGVIIAAILSILFAPIGGRMNLFLLLLIAGIFGFSSAYIVLSAILDILSLFIKKLKTDYYTKFTIKMVIGSAATIILLIILIIGNFANLDGRSLSPIISTKQLLSDQIDNPGAESCTDPVTFTKKVSQISAEELTRNTRLNYEQVIFANPDDILNFYASNYSLKYTGTTNKKVIMCAICSGNGKTGLERALQKNGVNLTTISSTIEETLCVIYPKKG